MLFLFGGNIFMDYAKFAIILWIAVTIILAFLGRKSIFRQFGMRQTKPVAPVWLMYLFCTAIIGAVVSIGVTFLIKSF
jgi:uncharacterized membrane protein YeaQ/YmgE (transglycosylase-associated protein family)